MAKKKKCSRSETLTDSSARKPLLENAASADLEKLAQVATGTSFRSWTWLAVHEKREQILKDFEQLIDMHHDTSKPHIHLTWMALARVIQDRYGVKVGYEAIKRAFKNHYGEDLLLG